MTDNRMNRLVIFQSKEIRRAWHEEEWHFYLVDVVGALTGSANPNVLSE